MTHKKLRRNTFRTYSRNCHSWQCLCTYLFSLPYGSLRWQVSIALKLPKGPVSWHHTGFCQNDWTQSLTPFKEKKYPNMKHSYYSNFHLSDSDLITSHDIRWYECVVPEIIRTPNGGTPLKTPTLSEIPFPWGIFTPSPPSRNSSTPWNSLISSFFIVWRIAADITSYITQISAHNLQSVAKLMTHLTVFGEFSSITNLGKTSPPSSQHVVQTQNDHSAGKSDQHWLGEGGNLANGIFFSCSATFINKIPTFCSVTRFATDCLKWSEAAQTKNIQSVILVS